MNAQPVQIGLSNRESLIKRGRRLEYFTIAYNSLEGLIAVVAGLMAGSIALKSRSFKLLAHIRRIPGLVFFDLESQEVINCLQGFGTVGRYANPCALFCLFELVLDIAL